MNSPGFFSVLAWDAAAAVILDWVAAVMLDWDATVMLDWDAAVMLSWDAAVMLDWDAVVNEFTSSGSLVTHSSVYYVKRRGEISQIKIFNPKL